MTVRVSKPEMNVKSLISKLSDSPEPLSNIYEKDGNVGVGVVPSASKFAIAGLPTSATGLATGDIWSNLGVLTVV